MTNLKTKAKVVLRVEHLKKAYGKVEALKGISFDIKEGELFSLLGPNGAGKTTTIRIISGLTKRDSGKVTLFGKELRADEVSLKRYIGYVPQQVNLDLELSVYENMLIHGILFGLSPGEIKRKAVELLRLAELDQRSSAKVKELSGGMRRRLLILRALLHQPRLLLLDEPTVGLDPHIRRKIWHLIKRIQEGGTSILLTTHYMEEAEYLSDRVAFIFNGRILRIGKPSDLISELGEYALDVYSDSGMETLYFKDRPLAEAKMLTLNHRATSLSMRRVNLEDVFMKLLASEQQGS